MECKKYEDSKIRSWRAEDGAEQMIKEDISGNLVSDLLADEEAKTE